MSINISKRPLNFFILLLYILVFTTIGYASNTYKVTASSSENTTDLKPDHIIDGDFLVTRPSSLVTVSPGYPDSVPHRVPPYNRNRQK